MYIIYSKIYGTKWNKFQINEKKKKPSADFKEIDRFKNFSPYFEQKVKINLFIF